MDFILFYYLLTGKVSVANGEIKVIEKIDFLQFTIN